MLMRTAGVAVVCLIAAAGCATPAIQTDTVKSLTDEQLCHNWATTAATVKGEEFRALVWQEISQRELFSEADMGPIRRGELRVGMPELAIPCAWGPASSINRTQTAQGTHLQWVYRSYAGGRTRFAYSDNGRVTAIQD